MRADLLLAALFVVAAPVAAQQSIAALIAQGDSARTALHSDAALRHYQEAIKVGESAVSTQLEEVAGVTTANPQLYTALWKGAREIADVAKQLLGDSLKDQRDSLYSIGRTWAEAAIKLDSADANGHYALALVLGRLSRTRGGKERVRFAKIIYDEAVRTVQIDPRHDSAWHILGIWNAEVKRLSGFTRFFAKALFGAGFMDLATWDHAVADMERAVALKPQHIYHRLELAGVYLDVGEVDSATVQLERIATLPIGDPMDPYYKEHAATALADIRAGKVDDAKDLLRKG
jgi:tetratricopeptide (TPR) repeat protein